MRLRQFSPWLFLYLIGLLAPVFLCAQQDQTSAAKDEPQEQSQPSAKPNKDADRTREAEVSSSKDTRIDLSPPANDAKNHPDSGTAIYDEEHPDDVQEFHPWDPHKAAKDVEVGDYYFKRKNYRAAISRYQEALVYKPNDAIANFRLAQSEEKTGETSDAIAHYEAYLKILPHGPDAAEAEKSLEHLKSGPGKETSSK